MIERIIYSEYESFDECYQICKYMDNEGLLVNFFLTNEFDSRVRLNYVIENGELLCEK